MKAKFFKLDSNRVLILLGILFASSIVYLFISASRPTRPMSFELFTTKAINIEYYYIDGCPHCVSFDPVWTAVSANAELNSHIEFKKLEISQNQDRARKYGISSAPTVIAVRNSDDMKLAMAPSESRTEASFTAFVQNYLPSNP